MEDKHDRVSIRSHARAIANAVVAFGLAASIFFTSNNLSRIWNPGEWGWFGFQLGDSRGWSGEVVSIAPGSAAERAGIKTGDRLDFVTAGDRALAYLSLNTTGLPNGAHLSAELTRPGVRRTVSLMAEPLPPLSTTDRTALILLYLELLAGMGVALFLVLARPSRMTWGFYFVVLATIFQYSPDESLFLTSLVEHFGLWIFSAQNFTYLAAAVGFLVFCARFPTNAPTGWAKKADSAAPYIFVAVAALRIWHDVVNFASGASAWAVGLDNTAQAANVLIIVAALVVLFIGFFDARNAERQRIKWVVLGLVSSFIAIALWTVSNDWNWLTLPESWSYWWMAVLALLALVLPLTVTYSIVRHRVIDVRFILDRSLTLGFIASVATFTVFALDWLFSVWLPPTPIVMAVYGAIAALIGLSLGAARRQIRTTIDYFLFRRSFDTQKQADVLAGAMSRARDKTDIYEPLTTGIARAFSIASAAIFERVTDGGYVRVAAVGWATETFWHLFEDDPLVKGAQRRVRSLVIDLTAWHERGVPAGVARPTIAVLIRHGKQVPALALYGAHENGTGIDPDETKMIHAICAGASLVYDRIDSPGSELAPILSPRGAALGA